MTNDPPAQRPTDPYRRQPPTIDLAPVGGATPAGEKAAGAPRPNDSRPAEPPAAAKASGKAPVGAVPPPSSQTARPAAAPPAGAPPKPAAAREPSKDLPPKDLPLKETAPKGAVPKLGATAASPAPKRPDAASPSAGTTSTAPKAAEPGPTIAAPKRRTGALLAAGITGGLVGAACAVGADFYWRQPPADYESRLAALETRPAPAAPAPNGAALSGIDRRVAALETQTKSLAEGVEAAKAGPAGAVPAAPPAVDTALKADVAGLDGRIAKVEGTAGAAATQEALNAIGTRVQDLQRQAEEKARADATAIASLQAATGSLGDRLAADAKTIEAMRADLGRLPPALLTPALRAVAAAQASTALDEGAPLGPAIAALGRLGVPADALAPLRPYAEKPAPFPAALLAEFRPLGDKLTALPQGPSDSFTDRLKRIAEKVVTVRAVGDGSGDDVPGLVGQIEAALGRGAPAAAAAAWDRLPEASRQETAAWGAALKARVAASGTLRRLNADSLAALAAPAR